MQGVGASPDGKQAPVDPGRGRSGWGVFLFNSWLAGFLDGDTKSEVVAGAALLFFQLHHLNWSWANFISKFGLSLSFHSGEDSRCLSWEPWFFTHLAAV